MREYEYISTHTPRAGRNIIQIAKDCKLSRFLLTRPERGATRANYEQLFVIWDFYSHAPSGAQPQYLAKNAVAPQYIGADNIFHLQL